MSPGFNIQAMTAGQQSAIMQLSHKREVEVKTHINVVGLIHLVTGLLFTALALLVSVGLLVFAPAFNGAPPWSPEDAVAIVGITLAISSLFFVIGIPSLIAGIGLLKQKAWARTLAIVVAILALFSFPVGTIVGIYTLWVLTRQETGQLLGAAA
jgi:hypothetical protein